MARVIHARIDAHTEKLVRDLELRLGWNDSRIVREGIKVLAGLMVPRGKRRIVGQGRFQSGMEDLGTNKEHLRGFGQ